MYEWVPLICRETLVAAYTPNHLNVALFLLRIFSITGCTDIWCLFQGISLRKDMKRKELNSSVHTCQEVRTELCLGYSSLECTQIINLQIVPTTVVCTNSVASGPGLSLRAVTCDTCYGCVCLMEPYEVENLSVDNRRVKVKATSDLKQLHVVYLMTALDRIS